MKKILLLTAIIIPMITKAQSFEFKPYVDQEVSCYGNNDGYIQGVVKPDGDYTFTIKKGTYTSTNKSGTFTKLPPGSYKICATNGKITKCETLTVTQPKKLAVKFNVTKYPTATENGGISLDISGGTAELQPYLVTWKNSQCVIMNPDPNDNFSVFEDNLPADVYMVTIEDDRGCFFTDSYKLNKK